MHPFEERISVLSDVMQTARHIALRDPDCAAGQAGWEYLQFCVRHGYIGFPTSSPDRFSTGGYLKPGRDGGPTTPVTVKQSLGIIVCFSDEVMPCNPVQKKTDDGTHIMQSAYVSPKDRILVIGYVDWHTSVELALKLLHEARHARHHFGDQFESLPALDPDELHESRTWKYELNLLDAYGGQNWQQALQQEVELVSSLYRTRHRKPGEKYFAMSGQTYSTLNQVFGKTPKMRKTDRNLLLGMRANFLIAERAQLPDLDTAYANIVGAYYDWGQRQ